MGKDLANHPEGVERGKEPSGSFCRRFGRSRSRSTGDAWNASRRSLHL